MPGPRSYSLRFERALRRAADWHRTQFRKGSSIPYLTHLVAVALILERHGYDEDLQIAGLLHDAVEDAGGALETIATEFGPTVARIVAECSEQKTDAAGKPRPWRVRKQEHLDHLAVISDESKAVLLADKLHNLVSMAADLDDPALAATLWSRFNAPPEEILWYQHAMIEGCAAAEPRSQALAAEARAALGAIRSAHQRAPKSPAPGH